MSVALKIRAVVTALLGLSLVATAGPVLADRGVGHRVRVVMLDPPDRKPLPSHGRLAALEQVLGAAGKADEIARLSTTVPLLERYAEAYSFDWVMIVALAYQESKLDHSARSKAGAVGIMQLLPSTAADPSVAINDIEHLESNVHAGIKYLRFLADRYFADPAIAPLDRLLFAVAAYNAGPARIAQLRREATAAGLDPNRWFDHVERIAAKRLGRETVIHVANIHRTYVTYRRTASPWF